MAPFFVVTLLFFTSFHFTSCLVFPFVKINEELLRIKSLPQKSFLFPDGTGKIHLVNLQNAVEDVNFNPDKDVFPVIYVKNIDPIVLNTENRTSLLKLKNIVDFKKPFKIVVHGWINRRNDEMALETRNAFLKNMDVNVIVIDWSIGSLVNYGAAVLNVPKVADYLAKFILWLNTNGVPIDNFHLVGHSLGAHIVGIAGRSLSPLKVPYITGLDPAYPCWDRNSKRIRATDGKYVEIIHTNGGLFGLTEVVGSNDFYLNGGSTQPGCGSKDLGCSHNRAFKYFAETIDNKKFMGTQCIGLDELIQNRCANLSSLYMGGSKPKQAVGVFHVETKGRSPFNLD